MRTAAKPASPCATTASSPFRCGFPGLEGLYDADTICQRVTSRVRQGSIVLFHNAALHTPEALPAILTCLINDGYTVVPISQLILPQPYTIDHTGRQFPAETGA